MNKKIPMIFFALILLVSLISIVAAQEGTAAGNVTLSDVGLDKETCPGCNVESKGPPPIVSLGSEEASLPADFEGRIAMNGGTFKYGEKTYSGDGECNIDKLGKVNCIFTGEGEYAGVQLNGGDVSEGLGGELIINCPYASCIVDGIPFSRGSKADYIPGRELNMISGNANIPAEFIGVMVKVKEPDSTVTLDNGDTLANGQLLIEIPGAYLLVGSPTVKTKLLTRAGETITALDETFYIPRESDEELPQPCLEGKANCIQMGKETHITGKGIRLDVKHPAPEDARIDNIFFIQDPESDCKKEEGCLIVAQKKDDGTTVTVKVDKNSEDIVPAGSFFEGINTKKCDPLAGIECGKYIFADATLTGCGAGYCEIKYVPRAQSTSFFNFIGKAWDWITGRETAEESACAQYTKLTHREWPEGKKICIQTDKVRTCFTPESFAEFSNIKNKPKVPVCPRPPDCECITLDSCYTISCRGGKATITGPRCSKNRYNQPVPSGFGIEQSSKWYKDSYSLWKKDLTNWNRYNKIAKQIITEQKKEESELISYADIPPPPVEVEEEAPAVATPKPVDKTCLGYCQDTEPCNCRSWAGDLEKYAKCVNKDPNFCASINTCLKACVEKGGP